MLGVVDHDHVLRCIIIYLLVSSPYIAANSKHAKLRGIGGIVDYSSIYGKQQKIAMEMAIVDCYSNVPLHLRAALHVMDSGNDPLKAASSGGRDYRVQYGMGLLVLSMALLWCECRAKYDESRRDRVGGSELDVVRCEVSLLGSKEAGQEGVSDAAVQELSLLRFVAVCRCHWSNGYG
ncbi:hypothetical protein POM88_012401 [Heracleum sosnowskyi]|uniref:Uncharacterized protein n=1 Tax=Heracleum sosnowskyi TaxID=360622 RepID=A0AAD8MXC0_9APIA|nr:hypothetical protein POM88_012401 [Heracleum sosnowskyi]